MTAPSLRRGQLRGRRVPVAAPVGGDGERGGVSALSIVALAAIMVTLILVFDGWLLTSRETGIAYQRVALVRITEIDRLVIDGQDDLRRKAAASTNGVVRLPGYPIAVDLPADFAVEAEPEALREMVLQSSADLLYEEGAAAFVGEEWHQGSSGAFTALGSVRRALLLVNADRHRLFMIGLAVAGLALLAATVATVLRARSAAAATTTVGVAFIGAGAFALLSALAVSGLLRVIRDIQDDALATQLVALGLDIVDVVLRTATIVGVGGLVLLFFGWWLWRTAPVVCYAANEAE